MAVTDVRALIRKAASLLLILSASMAQAAVLPEDRADVLYHSYDGGGITIDGPSVLVRKSVMEDVSISAQYYVDQITSASIDVLATASQYNEERTEYSINADYLLNKTIISGGYTNSTENDYDADTYFFGVSQDFFGDLSTLSLNYSYGADVVGKSTDLEFSEDVRRQSYQFGWTQVISKNLIMNFIYHITTDEGYLNNPYRSVRYLDPSNLEKGFTYEPEVYPETRTSQAFSVRGRYFMPYRAAASFEYRRFRDTWGINAYNLDLGYTHPFRENWIFDIHYRFYSQDDADFYSDLFPRFDFQNYKARDKELSMFKSSTFGIGIEYEFDTDWTRWLEKGTLNLAWDHLAIDYDNFRDVTKSNNNPGEEPFYSLDADIVRFYLSVWF